jgi:preprotein translocase subunit YajC
MPTPPVKFPKPNRSSGKPPVRKSDSNGTGGTPGSEQNWRGLILLFLTVLCMLTFYYLLIHPGVTQTEMTQAQLFDLIKAGRVTSIVNEPDPSTGIRGRIQSAGRSAVESLSRQ